jgi:hypothetical protein
MFANGVDEMYIALHIDNKKLGNSLCERYMVHKIHTVSSNIPEHAKSNYVLQNTPVLLKGTIRRVA